MARLRARVQVFSGATDIDVGASATVKFYAAGTASVSGNTTTGTPFAGGLYTVRSGGSDAGTSFTADSTGQVVVYTPSRLSYDVGIEIGGASPAAKVVQYEAFETPTEDVMASVSGEQSLVQTGTVAAPSLAHVGNLDTGFGIDSGGDPFIAKDGQGVFEVLASSTVIRSPDGGDVLSLTNDGLTTAPRVLERYGVYNVLDHGIVTGSTSTNAAANTTALEALWVTAANNGVGGTIYFPPGQYPFNATDLNHNLAIGVPIWLVGAGSATVIKFYGATGPFWDVAANANSQVARCGIRGFKILHDTTVTGGATIRLGLFQSFILDDVRVLYDSDTNAAIIPLQVGVSTLGANDLLIRDCQFWTQGDLAGTQIGIDFSTGGSGTGRFTIKDTQVKGNTTDSIGIRFNNTTLVDTVHLGPGLVLEQHNTGIQHVSAGIVSNLFATAVVLDQIVTYAVRCEPGAIDQAWSFNQCWIRVEQVAFFFTTAGGAAPSRISITNCPYITNDVNGAVYVGPGISNVQFANNYVQCLDATNAYHGVEIGDNATTSSNVVAMGNLISVGSTATSSLFIGSAVDSFMVGGNMLRGKDQSIGGTYPTNARVVLDKAFLA